jgi:hypothetical protein
MLMFSLVINVEGFPLSKIKDFDSPARGELDYGEIRYFDSFARGELDYGEIRYFDSPARGGLDYGEIENFDFFRLHQDFGLQVRGGLDFVREV